MNHDAFISYSSIDVNIAMALCHYLEENKIRCWMAPRNIPGGAEYGDVINEAIKASRIFVIVYSGHSAQSQWCKAETNLALANGKIIIPLKIDDSIVSGAMQFYLNDKHWIDAFPNPEEHYDAVSVSIRHILDGNDLQIPNAYNPKSLRYPNKWLRLILVLFSSVFGLWGGLFCVASFVWLFSPRIRERLLCSTNDSWMLPIVIAVTAPIVFLLGILLSQLHPWLALRQWAKKESWQELGARKIIMGMVCGMLRLFVAWIFILLGGGFCCWFIIVFWQKISAEGTINAKTTLSILLNGGLLGIGMGVPIFKAGWALLDGNYSKFKFTPRRLFKWIAIILIPIILYGVIAYFSPSIIKEWQVDNSKDVTTQTAIQLFNAQKWDEGLVLASNKENTDVQFYLGLCYERGYGGVARNEEDAVYWYRRSAEKGNASALCNLGLMYEKKSDYTHASDLYAKAISNGSSTAKAFFADMLENGKGCQKDVDKAFRLYLEAATNGNEFAKLAADRMACLAPPLDKVDASIMSAVQTNVFVCSGAYNGMPILQVLQCDPLCSGNAIVVQPGSNLLERVNACNDGDMLFLLPGRYELDDVRIKKAISIIGLCEDVGGVVLCNANLSGGGEMLYLINLTVENKKSEGRIWIEDGTDFYANRCEFKGVKINLGRSSTNIIVGSTIQSSSHGVVLDADSRLALFNSLILSDGMEHYGIWCGMDSICTVMNSSVERFECGIKVDAGGVVAGLGVSIKDCASHFIQLDRAAYCWGMFLDMYGCTGGSICDGVWLSRDSNLYLAGCDIKNVAGDALSVHKGAVGMLVNCRVIDCERDGWCDGRLDVFNSQHSDVGIMTSDTGVVAILNKAPFVPDALGGRLSKKNVFGTIRLE